MVLHCITDFPTRTYQVFNLEFYLLLDLLPYQENSVCPEKNLHGIVVNMLDCDIIVSEFKLQSHYYVHFWTKTLEKGMSSFIPRAID